MPTNSAQVIIDLIRVYNIVCLLVNATRALIPKDVTSHTTGLVNYVL